MNLDEAQKRIIKSKPVGYNVVKGTASSGKTTVAVHRALYLKNNYCLTAEDEIVMIASEFEQMKDIKNLYHKVEEETKLEYRTLFSSEKDRLCIFDIESIAYEYFLQYKKSNKCSYEILQTASQKAAIVQASILSMKEQYKDIKFFDISYTSFFIEEISWIKACNYKSLEEYQNAERVGRKCEKGQGPQRVLKNSKARRAIYELTLLYNKSINDANYIDDEDMIELALKQAKKKNSKKYTHIIVDEMQNLTKMQLEFIKTLCSYRTYSSIMFVVNRCETKDSRGWFVKGRKLSTIVEGKTGRNYNLKKSYIPEVQLERKEEYSKVSYSSSIENFQYCDIRHNRKYDFLRDADNITEVIVNDEADVLGTKGEEYKIDSLMQLPVYSDIAAGEPIFINSELESNFYVPQYWLKGRPNCFILKVRGDSMIGANIEDGDFVVIDKQHSAQNHDIVAVELDGNATLKRLSIEKKNKEKIAGLEKDRQGSEYIYENVTMMLMPENKKYKPISIHEHDEQVSIIGIAVGIIKNKNKQ